MATQTAPLALTIPDASRAAGIGRSSLYLAIGTGQLAARKLGRRTIILADDLAEFLKQLPALNPSRRGEVRR